MQDELNTYHRRSSHAGSSSLDSSSIYALLSFDSSPEKKCTNCSNPDTDSLMTPVDRLKPVFCKDGIRDGDNVKYRHKKETRNEAERSSVTSLVSAVPNHYIDSSSSAIGKKQLVVSLPDAEQSRTPEDSSVHLSVNDEMSTCNGLTLLPSAGGDDRVLSACSNKTSLANDDVAATEQCPEINRRRYSCGDQLAATWWRLLDRASSFSDLRVLPRSLSRLCCSTWRTFTGVKSPCIDVSKVGNVGPLQPCETSRLNSNRVNASVGDEVMEQSVSQWWHKPVSPDRRRLIEISDVENSSVYEDSPRKVNDNAQSVCESVRDSQLSDSDSAGSYVSLRVNCRSSPRHKLIHNTHCGNGIPRADCDILDDSDTHFTAVELPTNHGQEHVPKQTGDVQELFSSVTISNGSSPVSVSRSSLSTTCTAVQSMNCGLTAMPCKSFTRSLSSRRCSETPNDQLSQSNNGYINLSLGLQSCSSDRQSATFLSNGSSPNHVHPAKISTETKSVPNLGNDSVMLLDSLSVHAACSAGKERLSCDNSTSSDESTTDRLSRKSSNRLLRLIRCASAKSHKQPATYSAGVANHTESPAVGSADSSAITVSCSAGGNDEQPYVHRLPSPNVPPPPVPDDTATSRLFQLCRTTLSEHLPMNISADSDTLSQYEDLSLMKSCAAAKKSSTLSSSYSAGDKQHYDSMNQTYSDNIRLSAQIPTHRHRHGQFPFVTYCFIKFLRRPSWA